MKQNNKIAAFTLSEVLVVLILTAIVVGMAFSVLSLVQKHMSGIQKNLARITELNKLEIALWIDFNKYNSASFSVTENQLLLYSEIDSTQYSFTKEYIIRKKDTFKIKIERNTLFFKGEQLEETGVIDAIKLETSKAFQNRKIFIYKENDASKFMN